MAFWTRIVRNRLQKSVETLIGRTATVRSACRPHGQVHLDGYIWEARCAEGADRGESVTVVSRDLLWLVVERLEAREQIGNVRRVERRGRRSVPSLQPALLRRMDRGVTQFGASAVRRSEAGAAFGAAL